MEIVWSPRAIADLAHIWRFVAKDKPEAAKRLAHRIRNTISFLSSHPHLGRPGIEPGTRELIVAGTPYIVPYMIHHNTLAILAVFHGAQKRP